MPRKKAELTEALTEQEEKNLGTPPDEDDSTPEVIDEEDDPLYDEEPAPADDDGGGESEPKKKGVVPHAAMHEERERRQHVEKEYNDLNEKYIRLSERTQLILQQIQERSAQEQAAREQAAAPKMPDRETEPFEYMQWLEGRVNSLEGGLNQRSQQEQFREKYTQAINYGNSLAAQYREQVGTDVYDDAFNYVTGTRAAQLRALQRNEQEIPLIIKDEIEKAIIHCLQNNIHPGQMLYQYALNSGWRPKGARGGNGKTEAEQRLAIVADAQRKTKSLGQGSRSAGTGLSVEDLAKMSDEDFESWYGKNGQKGLAKSFSIS